jgi:hypothetical protein
MKEARGTLLLALSSLLAASCSSGKYDPASAIPGRWLGQAREKVALEFLPGGTLVKVSYGEGGRIESVGAGDYRFTSKQILHYDLTSVGRRKHWSMHTSTCVVGKEKLTFTVMEGDKAVHTGFDREDPPLSPAQAALVGLWKRAEPPEGDATEMGVIFTPGGVEVLVGQDTPWDAETAGECGEYVCLSAEYRLADDGTLEEAAIGPDQERRRTRTIEVSGDLLTIRQEGREELVYRRVRSGGLPVSDGRLDLEKWEALE